MTPNVVHFAPSGNPQDLLHPNSPPHYPQTHRAHNFPLYAHSLPSLRDRCGGVRVSEAGVFHPLLGIADSGPDSLRNKRRRYAEGV